MTDPRDAPEAVPAGEGIRGVARPGALGFIAFAATLALLFGLTSLVVDSAPPPRASASASGGALVGSVASPSASTTVAQTPSPSLSPRDSAIAGPSGSAGASGSIRPSGSSVASPSPGGANSDPVLVGAGDIADCGLPDDSKTADLVAAIPGTVFTAGDNAYPDGTKAQFDDCYGPTWGRFLDRTKPAPGNHDHNTKDLAGYRVYFGSAASPVGTLWYSYDLGTWHIVVLDSMCGDVGGCGPDTPQGRWLASDLAASNAKCTLAVWHHPRWSSGEHGNDGDVAPFWNALYKAGADVVVNGHDHDYERFAPQDPAGHEDRTAGIREFVVGTGGAALRPFFRQQANSEVRDATDHGVISFTLHQGSYDWAFETTGGAVIDRGTAFCH